MTRRGDVPTGFWAVVARIAESPALTMGAGILLLLTAGWEIVEGLGEEFAPGAHHGLAVFGLVQVIAAMPHCLHGVKQMHESHRQVTDDG